MLAENHRLGCLPEISTLFDEYKDEAEHVIDVTVTSAAPLDSRQQQTLGTGAGAQAQAQGAHCNSPRIPTLLGGAVLRAGDTVIDGSLHSRLETHSRSS